MKNVLLLENKVILVAFFDKSLVVKYDSLWLANYLCDKFLQNVLLHSVLNSGSFN